MKKIYAALLCLPVFASAITYNGNTRAGFGGTIGNSVLSVTDNGTTISFTLTKGTTGDFNDALVLYIDSKTGGFNTTLGFGDNADALRRAISGTEGGANRTTINFGNNFLPDYAIAVQPTNFGGLWELANGGANSLIFKASVGIAPATNNAASYTFSVLKADIGIIAPIIAFDFIGTYISGSAFRADEAIGFDIATGNPGFNGTVNTVTKFQYPSGVLLPVTLTSFTGALKNNNVNLTWNTATENNLSHFEIEQSTDGRSWIKAGIVAGVNSANGANYQFDIQNVTANFMLYRLKITDKDGRSAYSQQVTIKKSGKANIELIGNPVKNVVRLAIHQPETATFSAEIISLNGRRISNTIYQHNGGSAVYNINIPAVAPGMYLIKVSSATSKETFKLMVN